jgi:SAM-dependent methyltransferase
MDLDLVGQQLKAAYRDVVPRYRRDDEIEVQTSHHRRLWTILRSICLSFPIPTTVLDAGCGTGRYFHCLENVEHLIGVDVSPDMLKAAANPVLSNQVTVQRIELICQNIFHAPFAPSTFDFIYSLGMFGNGCPVTTQICEHFFAWLKPGGKLFFDALSVTDLPLRIRMRHKARRFTCAILPARMKRHLDERQARLPLFALTHSALGAVMQTTPFTDFHISTQTAESPLWGGGRLECLAQKPTD